MKIRTKLTIVFTIITVTIFLFYASIIYLTAKESREKEFYSFLRKESVTKANLFFEGKFDIKILQDIYKSSNRTSNEVEIAIYDSNFNLLYQDVSKIDLAKETFNVIDKIYQQGELKFYKKDWQILGFRYLYESKNYIIMAAGYDNFGYNKLKSLWKNSIIVFLVSVGFIYLVAHHFSKNFFAPIKAINLKAREISARNLNIRIDNNKNKDELSELTSTFNDMLDRLKNSFESQNQFVSNIAHELRTPLTSIITELELSLLQNRTPEDYKRIIQRTYSDSKKMVRIINNLLDFAKANYDSSVINFKPVRIDEILIDARSSVQKSDNSFKVDVFFQNDFDKDTDIMVNGNEYFLRVAFVNLMENGCKYSADNYVKVSVAISKENIELKFIDNGIGIPKEDIQNIFEPFYRGKNKDFTDGSGIGLSLVSKIIHLHKGMINIESHENQGSVFTVILPNVSVTL